MPKKSLIERAVILTAEYVPPSTTLSPGPARYPARTPAALRRCCAAWKRAYDAYFLSDENNRDSETDRMFAAQKAGVAYRNAMPLLVGYEGVRDFIACAAHGILIGAIPREESGQVLYAAQVALSIAQSEHRLPKPTTARTPKSAFKSASE
jgi:hypothetical protein